MESTVFAVPRCEVTLTKDEVKILMECSAAHYDGRCKSAGKPGPDGIIWQFTHDGKGVLWSQDVNLIMKVLEQASLVYLGNKATKIEAWKLQLGMLKLFRKMYGKGNSDGTNQANR